MIAFQLKLLEWIIHKKMKFYKIFAASIFGSFSGCLILQLYDEDHGLKLGLMIISIVMTVKISCAFPMKKAWKYSVYLLVLSLFTGGIFTMIKSQIILPWLILATASCMLVRYLYVSAVKDMNHDKESFYQVEFTILHKKLEVCAFLDTGNFLYEPVSQMPVCILEEETFLKYFHEPLFKMIEKQEAEGIHKNVIVIGRQYGCGGHDIGKKLAEKFGYEFYDQEIIQMIAGTTGMTSEFIRQKEESMTNSLLYDFVNQMYLYGKEEEEAPKDKIFEAESKVIRELAAKGKCVIIGRCSDYVLCENEKTLKLFFAAPLEVRAKRIMERLNISKKEAEQVIRKEDRRRADNYRYYTGRVWGSAANVDLTFNTAMDERYIEECISKAMELEI